MRKPYAVSLSVVSLVLLGLAFLSSSCQGTSQPRDKIGAVVTIVPQADFVENVGGEKVDVTVMVPPGADPHTYELTPSQMMKVSKAKMYAKVGSGVEFELVWMDKIIEQIRRCWLLTARRAYR